MGKVLNAIEDADARVKIIILDACRDNPFYRRWRSTGRSLATRGLSGVSSAQGTLIAFSTAPGTVAADFLGEKSRNSPYTTQLLKFLKTPNLEIGQMFRRVREGVLKATENEQIPWVSESLIGDVFLNPKEVDIAVSSPSIPSTPIPKPTPQVTPPNSTFKPTPEPTFSDPEPTPQVTLPPIPEATFSDPEPTPQVTLPPIPEATFLDPTPQPSPSSKPSIQEIALVSSRGINYTKLRDLLAQGKWKEADEETHDLILKVTNKEGLYQLYESDIQNLSCEDLRTIDRLWVAYSKGKFGFSVQREIYRSLGGKGGYNEQAWRNFGHRVGWRLHYQWIVYSKITYDLKAPKGHLPILGYAGWLRASDGFFLRSAPCKL